MTPHPTARRLILLGTPLLLAVLMLYHTYGGVGSRTTPLPFMALHLALLPLFMGLAWGGWLLLDGVRGTAAWVSRLSLGLFVPLYSAYDAVYGLARSMMYDYAARYAEPELGAAVAQAAGSFWRYPAADAVRYGGAALWCVGLLAAVWALAHAGRPRWPLFFLTLSAVALLFDHLAPPGTMAFGAFWVAAWGLERHTAEKALAAAPSWGKVTGCDSLHRP
jgi:hypothetical protein